MAGGSDARQLALLNTGKPGQEPPGVPAIWCGESPSSIGGQGLVIVVVAIRIETT